MVKIGIISGKSEYAKNTFLANLFLGNELNSNLVRILILFNTTDIDRLVNKK
jgi:hypothetical protein